MTPVANHHPSFLALDRAILGHAPADLAAHLAVCDQCQEHVRLAAIPGSASDFASIEKRLKKRRAFLTALFWGSGAVAAAAGVILLVVARAEPSAKLFEGPYVGAKGFPSVWIYVKRGSGTELWDGKKPFSVGDRLRIKVDPASYHHVQVYALDTRNVSTVLYAGAVPSEQATTLPGAWELDASVEPERLFVVFADRAVSPSFESWLHGRVESDVSVLPFELPKGLNDDAMAP